MNFNLKSHIAAAFLLVGSFVFFIILALNSEGSYGGADSFMHYLIARFAFSNPELYLDHWGKPVFTLLASPFAQLGFIGVRIFNILCGVLAALFAYLTAHKLNLKFSLVALILTLYATLGLPVYLSGLTEPLFALFLVMSIYYWVKKRYSVSAFIISWIVLVRTEGFIFLPLFLTGLILMRQFKAIPFLFAGVTVYSIVGGIVLGDLLWIITSSPYGMAPSYGKGEILHFWNYRNETYGKLYVVLFIIGSVLFVFNSLKKKHNTSEFINWSLILFCFLGYFIAHSVVWSLGTGSSAGLTRVMAGIIPLGAIVASYGLEPISSISFVKKQIFGFNLSILMIIGFFQVYPTLNGGLHLSIPSKWGLEEEVLQKVADQIRSDNLTDRYIVYYNPIVAFLLDLNPFTAENSKENVYNVQSPEEKLEVGTLIIYDNHFGPNEGGLPEQVLVENSHFKLYTKIVTESDHFGSDGERYHVSVYEKID